MSRFFELLATCSAVVSTACAALPAGTFRTVGPINAGTVKSVENQLDRLKQQRITPQLFLISYSPGGDADALLQLVDVVNANADQVFVSGECLSACAEFLLLVNKPIIASKNAKIGFHGDALTANALIRPLGLKGAFPCIERRAELSRSFLERRGVNADQVTRLMIKRLTISRAQEVEAEGDGCRDARFYSMYRMWFPTTEELRSLLNIDIKGPICSDDTNCIRKFATERWTDKPTIVVGDKLVRI